MGAVPYPLPRLGPIAVPATWDGYHDVIYPGYQSYEWERDWCVIRFTLPVPLDQAMTRENLDWMFSYAIWTGIKTGGPLRAMLWYRQTRGVSGLYDYEVYLEYADHRVAPGSMSYAIWGCLVLIVKNMNAILNYGLHESGSIAAPAPPAPAPGDIAVTFVCTGQNTVSATLTWQANSAQVGVWVDMPHDGTLDVVLSTSPTQKAVTITGLPANAEGDFAIVANGWLVARRVARSPDCPAAGPEPPHYDPPTPTPPEPSQPWTPPADWPPAISDEETKTNWMPYVLLGGAVALLFFVMRGRQDEATYRP